MDRLPLLPEGVRIVSGQLEDQMETWRQRRLGYGHPDVRRAGVAAVDLCGDIIVAFQEFRDALFEELREYDKAARKGQA